MDKRNLAFGRTNFILLGVSMFIVILGFVLMAGPGSTEEAYNPDIFSFRRIRLAPVVCFLGFVSMIVAIVYNPAPEKKGSSRFFNLLVGGIVLAIVGLLLLLGGENSVMGVVLGVAGLCAICGAILFKAKSNNDVKEF